MTTLLCRQVITTVIGAGLVACAIGACAAVKPDGAEQLTSAPPARIANVCESIMGLRPSDRMVSGVWPGNPRLPQVVSHYETCVISLSDSLQQAQSTEAARRADARCRAQGLSPNSPELAVCVLQSSSDYANQSEHAPTADSNLTAALPARRAGSYYYASANEVLRREQMACAELGFEPPSALFTDCVHNLSDNLSAIDNPIQ